MDVDVLAEFEPGALLQAGWNYFGYGEELGQLPGHKVDFCSRLYPLIQNRGKDSLLTIYERSWSHRATAGDLLWRGRRLGQWRT